MKEMLTRRVEWIEISEDDYYNKGIQGIERTSIEFGIGYTVQDYYADNANITIKPIDDNDYCYTNDDGELILIIVFEYFYINFNQYENDEESIGTLGMAMDTADIEASYTQQDILIYGDREHKNLIARRRWYGTDIDEDVESKNECIDFGKFGHYGAWEVFDY